MCRAFDDRGRFWYYGPIAFGRFLEPMNKFITFLREVRVELGKVSWPSRNQLLVYTGVVIGLCLLFAVYLGGLDTLFAWILNRLIG